jgi:arylsulfatase
MAPDASCVRQHACDNNGEERNVTERGESRPNILLILTDQQRGDCLGIAGQDARSRHEVEGLGLVLETPHLDFLGRSGAYFRCAYAEAPICVPARRTLMSGQAPAAHGVLTNYTQPWDPPHTLAGELRKADYQTEMVGKLHLSPARKRFGFDHLVLANSPRGRENDYVEWLAQRGALAPLERWAMAHGATPNGWIGRPFHLDETLTHAFWCASEAIAFLAKRDPSVPFFLNVSFYDPHPPCTPPAFCFERYDAIDLPAPVVGDWAPDVPGPRRGDDPEAVKTTALVHLDARQMHRWRAAYLGAINYMDYQVGRLLQYMREAGLLDNTFILFTSDHGEMLGDHHMIGKARAFEGAAHVPFLCRPPAAWGYPSGQVIDAPVGLQDVMPTLLDAAGVPIPETVTGRSLLPLLRGEIPAREWRDALHGEHPRRYPQHGAHHYLTDGHTKYIWYSETGQELLFDLDEDPQERHNLAGDPAAAGRLARWRERLVRELEGRPEGFVAGGRLVPGRPHGPTVP